MDFPVRFLNPRSQAFLRIRDSLVVDDGPDFLHEEVQAAACANPADALIEVLVEEALQRDLRLSPQLLGQFDGPRWLAHTAGRCRLGLGVQAPRPPARTR